MEKRYSPKEIEPKWQKEWERLELNRAGADLKKPKFYPLVEFPYPSGAGLHTGHVRGYTAMDVVARKRRYEGYDVLYPIGWDAFGLPTENYAIKTGIHPEQVTKENTENFRRQLKSIGFSFDWSREIDTTDPAYYKWTQWIFLRFFEKGLAYKAKMAINWCPSCKIGLANEEVVDGGCERCGNPVEQREKEQWMLAITKYADRLHDDLDLTEYWDKIKIQQRNWIGRSEGVIVRFPVSGTDGHLEVFTTRIDTLFSGAFLVLAPEHPFIRDFRSKIGNIDDVEKYVDFSKKETDIERTAADKEKTGVELRGVRVVNPATGKEIPVWVSDFVLGHYGTGAVFADAHDKRDFEMAKRYGIPLSVSIKPVDGKDWRTIESLDECFEGEGVLVNSGQFDGLTSAEARVEITAWLEGKGLAERKVNYKLRDWVFSRQRYWGEPIPIVHCEKCGWVAVPDEELPVTLPRVEKYQPTDTGESPLAAMEDWVATTCPSCDGPARRETDTMPNWAGSSWYFLRYVDPKNETVFSGQDPLKRYLPVDWYNGGMEHTTLHLLYSRFWHKFLYDLGLVPTPEPYMKRTSHGLILAKGGGKMSKSKGNVVNPDDAVADYGADALRVFEMFMAPFDQPVAWNTDGLVGARRFLEKVWKLREKVSEGAAGRNGLEVVLHRTIRKVSDDIEEMRFNTAISALMILGNAMEKEPGVPRSAFQSFLILLSPFAPHIAEELWHDLGNDRSIFLESWPQYDPEKAVETRAMIAVSVNGKVRDTISVPHDASEEELKSQALSSEKVRKYTEGKEPKKVVVVPGRIVNIVI